MEGVQGDAEVGEGVLVNAGRRADLDLRAQFLADLARQARGQALAGFQFAAGEFPQPAQQAVRRAAGDQHRAVAVQHCRGDGVMRHRRARLQHRALFLDAQRARLA